MSSEEEKRAAVLVGLRAGRSCGEIAEFNGLHRSLVYRVAADFNEKIEAGRDAEVTPKRKKHDRKTAAITRTPEFILELERRVQEDPRMSMRALAREMHCAESTIRLCIAQDLRYKSYKMRRGQLMTEATKGRRFEKAKKLLNKLKSPAVPNPLIFFSDEKNFDQDQKVNSQNDRWLCRDPEEVPIVMCSKFPATVMVLGVMSNEGDVMPPHFFKKGESVTSEVYINIMRTVVKPWMDQIAGDRHYVFQQDGAPAHTANKTQEWLAGNLPEYWPKEVWPPSSPDCNPLDYFMWSVVERDVNRTSHNTIDSLKTKIVAVMTSMEREVVIHAAKRFRSRIEAVIEAAGDFIE